MAEIEDNNEDTKLWDELLWKDYIAELIASGELSEEEVCIGLMTMDCRGLQGR